MIGFTPIIYIVWYISQCKGLKSLDQPRCYSLARSVVNKIRVRYIQSEVITDKKLRASTHPDSMTGFMNIGSQQAFKNLTSAKAAGLYSIAVCMLAFTFSIRISSAIFRWASRSKGSAVRRRIRSASWSARSWRCSPSTYNWVINMLFFVVVQNLKCLKSIQINIKNLKIHLDGCVNNILHLIFNLFITTKAWNSGKSKP